MSDISNSTSGTNRLALEPSAYLRQHAHQPVQWYPWGPEALALARELDRPIFLSIGYAACHWCHVMAHECFDDLEVAHLLNSRFVPVKVDREEHPDLDALYMQACQLISGRAGWPLTLLLTPKLGPFLAGTYFPKLDRPGMPGLLTALSEALNYWETRRPEVESTALAVASAILAGQQSVPGAPLEERVFERAEGHLRNQYDPRFGGFGGAPKFLVPHTLQFMLSRGKKSQGEESLTQAKLTFDSMLASPTCDQLGGGFHRYATDARWRVPHFEKMLYDQALMVLALCDAHEALGGPTYAEAVRRTLAFVEAELQAPDGTFYSSLDADSEGGEGRFYTWSLEQLEAALGADGAGWAVEAFGLELERPDLDGERFTLGAPLEPAVLALRWKVDQSVAAQRVEWLLNGLLQARRQRERPGVDDKVLTDWNGLMVAALARAGRVLGEERYLQWARQALEVLVRQRLRPDGTLVHSLGAHGRPIEGMLDDYAFLLWGVLELAQVPGMAQSCLPLARTLHSSASQLFQPVPEQGYYLSRADAPDLLVRLTQLFDGAIPSGNSVQLLNLKLLHSITGESSFGQAAQRLEMAFSDQVSRFPWAFTAFLAAAELGRL